MFPVIPTPPVTVSAPVKLVVETFAFVICVAPVIVPPVNEPPPPPVTLTVTSPPTLVATTEPVKFKLVSEVVSVDPSSCTVIAAPPPPPADPVYPIAVLAEPV